MKKKLIMLIVCTAMMIAFAGCGGSGNGEPENRTEAAENGGQLAGGWMVYADGDAAVLPDEVQTAFDKATEKLTGSEFVPLAYISRQIAERSNYQILCRATEVTADPVPTLQVLVIGQDPEDSVDVLNIADFDISRYTDSDGADIGNARLDGGWEVPEDYTKSELPEEVKAVYEKAIQQVGGSTFTPMAYLGSQVVAGTNYAVLVEGELASDDPVSNIHVVTIYEDLEGNVELTNICTLDPAEFNPRLSIRTGSLRRWPN